MSKPKSKPLVYVEAISLALLSFVVVIVLSPILLLWLAVYEAISSFEMTLDAHR